MIGQILFFMGRWCFIFAVSIPAAAQVVETNLELSAVTPAASVIINIPDGVIKMLRLTIYDADSPDEGELYINEQGPIALFPGGNGGNDGLTTDIDIRLTDQQVSWFRAGDNTLRFGHLRTQGFKVEGIAAIGDIALIEYPEIRPQLNGEISPARQKALRIYKRLVGITTPIDNPVLATMESHILSGNLSAAAQAATAEPGFLNNVVRDLAAKMSTREETVKTGLNDFIAGFIGTVRDQHDARSLLTGDFTYVATSNTPVASNLIKDKLSSNNHYQKLEKDGYDLGSVLARENSQYLIDGAGLVVSNPDPAGILTSRAFMEAHAIAGTNRRLVEYLMRSFTCTSIENWSDISSSDIRVGPDVERFPGGDGAKYQSTCKACHGNMDGLRGAFARYDFVDGFVKYSPLHGGGVAEKMNQNNDVFPLGHRTIDDSWYNFARNPANQARFGWRGTVKSGAGVGQLARMIANSEAFSQCMVKRVFQEICQREPATFEQPTIELLAATFEAQGYNLKSLFEETAIRTECLGE